MILHKTRPHLFFQLKMCFSTASAVNLLKVSQDKVQSFINSFDTVLFDCDGVLWRSGKALPGAPDVVNKLRDKGKRIFFITNNSMHNRKHYAEKAHALGFHVQEEEILSTAYLTAEYFKSIGFTKKVFVVGHSGIASELERVGIKSIGVGPEVLEHPYVHYLINMKLDPEVGAVVVGFDEHLSFLKVMRASSYLNNPDILFVATNTDERFPADPHGIVCPGAGVMVNAIRTCSSREPYVIGKPHDFISKAIAEKYKTIPARTLMVGDRGNTDILLGKRCGYQTLLVLTGVTSMEDLEKWKNSDKKEDREQIPDVLLPKLGDLLPMLV